MDPGNITGKKVLDDCLARGNYPVFSRNVNTHGAVTCAGLDFQQLADDRFYRAGYSLEVMGRIRMKLPVQGGR